MFPVSISKLFNSCYLSGTFHSNVGSFNVGPLPVGVSYPVLVFWKWFSSCPVAIIAALVTSIATFSMACYMLCSDALFFSMHFLLYAYNETDSLSLPGSLLFLYLQVCLIVRLHFLYLQVAFWVFPCLVSSSLHFQWNFLYSWFHICLLVCQGGMIKFMCPYILLASYSILPFQLIVLVYEMSSLHVHIDIHCVWMYALLHGMSLLEQLTLRLT